MTLSIRNTLLALATLLIPLAADAKKPAKATGDFVLLFVGGANGDHDSPTLVQLKKRLESIDPKASAVVFTGNYSTGELPAEGADGRTETESDLLAHVAAVKDFAARGGKVYFLPGNRDFAAGGTQAVRRLRKFLNGAMGTKEDVMPVAECGEPALFDLTDTIGIVLVNSQWFLQDWDIDPIANADCSVKTREAFHLRVRDAFNEYRTRRLVVASHHPLRTYGEMGGALSMRSHLTPAPIVGTVGVIAREAGLVPQYAGHPQVRAYMNMLEQESQRYGSFVFASGHDASLQLVKFEGQIQIISGTSSQSPETTAPVVDGDFAKPIAGWAELDLGPEGGGKVRFVSAGEVAFESEVPQIVPYAPAPSEPPGPMPASPVITTFTKGGGGDVGALTRFFIGSFYSDAYKLQMPYEVLDLEKEHGGLTPYKTGGSFQTNSLGMRDSTGAAWSVRAVTKDSSRIMGSKDPSQASGNSTADHGMTAIHPEAALIVPRLADAVGVLHAEPRLMYLPDQPSLGKYRGYIANELVLLERSPNEPKEGALPESIAGPPSPKGETRFRATAEAIEKIMDKPATHKLDQAAMLRARLLDILLGDWDRHQGQWKFAEIPNADGTKTYLPIPRDRDQALTNYNGFALVVARISAAQPRQLQPFNDSYGSLGWLIYSARDLDPILLNTLDHERWIEIATQMKAALTDAVIDEAFSTWHPESYALDGARLSAFLKQRRDQLVQVAADFYLLINKNAELVASTHDDRVDVWFENHHALRVTLRGAEKGAPIWFDRVYRSDQTDELRIYALDGDDTLVVHGKPHRGIVVRFVGGQGSDRVTAAEVGDEPMSAPAIRLYDAEDGAKIDASIAVSDERSELARMNQYDQTENHEPNLATFYPGLLVEPDEGVLLGGKYTHVFQGFKKTPFAARHDVIGRFSTATLGAEIAYRGIFPQSAEQLDQSLEVVLKAPTSTRNFFGYTNRYVDEGEPLDFYRVRQAAAQARYGLSYGFGGDSSRIGGQLVTQAFVTEATPGRFVTQSPDVAPDTFGARYFGGARLFAQTNTFDSQTVPTRGVAFDVSIESRYDLLKGTQFSTNYKLGAAAAIPFDRKRRFVLLSRVSLEGIVGDHPFFFSPTLGSHELRAYHSNQLAGDLAFAQTTDFRISILQTSAATAGVSLSVDHGRVFGPGISGNLYHASFGGSAWVSVMDTLAISVGYYRGIDGGGRFMLALGPLFGPPGI